MRACKGTAALITRDIRGGRRSATREGVESVLKNKHHKIRKQPLPGNILKVTAVQVSVLIFLKIIKATREIEFKQ